MTGKHDPLTLAVGDGNHSLATAKACWEELKKTLTPEQAENHPARWCLAEVCNVHSPAIEIEPIHRVLFNVDCAAVLLALITWSDENMAGCCFGGEKKQPFTLAGPHMANVLSFEEPTAPLTVGTIDEFIEYYLERHPEGRVDYVHDEPAVRALCKNFILCNGIISNATRMKGSTPGFQAHFHAKPTSTPKIDLIAIANGPLVTFRMPLIPS